MNKFLTIIGVFLFIGLLGVGGYLAFNIYFWEDVYEPVPIEDKTITVIDKETGEEQEITYEKQKLEGEPFTMLFLGVDSESLSHGRSDTIIVSVIEPESKNVTLLSIPRDTYVENQKTGEMDKITHAFNNGISNTISTVEEFLNIPIDYYGIINLDGFMDMVDAIGGVTIDVEKDMTFHDRLTNQYVTLKKGTQNLDGREALNYARFRSDGEGDFGRNRRQRQVIEAVIAQTSEMRSMSHINDMFGVLSENFRTNIKPLDIGKTLSHFDFSTNISVEKIELTGVPARRDGASVVISDQENTRKVTQILHDKLGF